MNCFLGILLIIVGIGLELLFSDKINEYQTENDNWFILYIIAMLSTFCIYFGIQLII